VTSRAFVRRFGHTSRDGRVWLWCVNVVLITGGISQGKIYFLILLKYAKPQSRVSPLLSRLLEFDFHSDDLDDQVDALLRSKTPRFTAS